MILPRRNQPIRGRLTADLAFGLVTLVGLGVFTWPFFVSAQTVEMHGKDAPWLFAVLVGLMAMVLLAETVAGGLDAKVIAVIGVLAAMGGALRVLSAGTAGLEPMFALIVLAGRVLGRSTGFVVGALAIVTGALLTGAVGPWMPFQMIAAGWVAVGAALLPRMPARVEVPVLAAYGLVVGLLYGAVMNLWFWPFLGASAGEGMGFIAGAGLDTNLRHYAVFYMATSLGWDLVRGLLTAALIGVGGRPILTSLRRAVRRAAFNTTPEFIGRKHVDDLGSGRSPGRQEPAR